MILEKKELVFLICGGILLYLLIVSSLYIFQRKLIYYPGPNLPERSVFNATDMDVIKAETEDGLMLSGWYKEPEEGKPVIVVFHGNASHMGMSAWKVRGYMDEGYGALLPAYRGYAGNPGRPTEKGLYKDARAFLSWLKKQGVAENNIVLLGESLGSGVAVDMAANDFPDVKAVILESPYADFVSLAKDKITFIPFMNLLIKDQYKSIDKIKDMKAPLFIIHGALDVIVPYKFGKQLFVAANEPKEMATLPMAGHNDLYVFGAGPRILHFLSGL